MGYVYILKSLKNNTYYIGSTDNLERRLQEHQSGKSPYTKEILPIILVFSQQYPTLLEARRAEAWLKKQKDRKLLKQIIEDRALHKAFS